jgi:PAS domain S-box-containing protein
MSIDEVVKKELLEAKEKEAEKKDLLALLNRLVALLPQELGVKKTCERLVRIVIEETDFENCSIALWEPREKCLTFAAGFGLTDMVDEEAHHTYHRNLKFRCGQDVASEVFADKKPVFIENVHERPIPPKASSVVKPACLVCVPLLDLGILNMSSSIPRELPEGRRRNWILMGNIIGHLVMTASLNERLTGAVDLLEHEVDRKTWALEEKNRELAAANHLLEAIIDYSPDGICVLDENGLIVRVSKGMEKFQGEAAFLAIGASPAVFFRDPRIFFSMIQEVSRDGKKQMLDIFMLGPDGTLQSVDAFLTKLPHDSEEARGYLLVVHDITQQKAFSEQLFQTEKLAALGIMAGGVAHDFNNTLMRILGNTQLLALQAQDESMKKRLQNIELAVQDAAMTQRRLQTFAGREDENERWATADLTQVIEEVIAITRPHWKSSMEKYGYTIELKTELAPQCFAKISPLGLREALASIVLNAVDAMPKGGTLRISTRKEDQWVFIDMEDSGSGMTEEVQRKIFDPFFTTKGIGSSGLGLSVSWKFIHRNGGDIQVVSQPGAGTTFRISLPGSEGRQPSAASTDAFVEPAVRRVLLVEDEPETLRLLDEMIQLTGHTVAAVQDGQEAMALIDREEFDLIFTDLGMPVVSGWEVARKAKEKNPLVPVILITGWGSQQEDDDLARRGIDLVLPKPFTYNELRMVLQRYLPVLPR